MKQELIKKFAKESGFRTFAGPDIWPAKADHPDDDGRIDNELEKFAECIVKEREKEFEQLQKYRNLVMFIANDYLELSYEKAQWQRDDWKKRCQKLLDEIER